MAELWKWTVCSPLQLSQEKTRRQTASHGVNTRSPLSKEGRPVAHSTLTVSQLSSFLVHRRAYRATRKNERTLTIKHSEAQSTQVLMDLKYYIYI